VKDYVLTLLVAAAATYILTPLVRRLAARIGAMQQPRERDVHVVPVATFGGLAMYGGLVAGLLVSEQIPMLRMGAFSDTGMLNGLLLAGGLLVVIGFIDDRWGMSALTKAAGQIAAGGILVATGTTLSWLPLPGGNTYLPDADQRTVLTILIVVATINAVNFIDGLDGLAAGIVCIAAVSFFIYYYSLTKVIHMSALAAPALVSAILIGMCIGFLPHNFSPATIFMGDTGSMLLGLLLAYAPISGINTLPEANLTSQINRYPVILPLLLPAALLIIPYADLLLAVVRRTRAGRSPFAPDRKHLHHRLLDIGHSQRTSVLIMYLWAAVFSGSVVWLSVEKTVQPRNAGHHGEPIVVFVLITVAAVAVLLLMSMPRLRWWQQTKVASADAGTAADLAPAGGLASAAGLAPAAELAPGAAAAQRRQPDVAAEPRLAGISAGVMPASGVSPNGVSPNGVSASGVSPSGVSASGVTPSLGARVESLARPLPAEAMQPDDLLGAPVRDDAALADPDRGDVAPADPLGPDSLRPDPLRPDPVRAEPVHAEPTDPARNGHAQSLAFWREAEPQAPSLDVRRPTLARSKPVRTTPAQPTLARPTPARSTMAPPASARPEDRSSDYGPVGPARSIVGSVPPAVTGQAPVPTELGWPADDSEHADTRPLPSDGRGSE
jgi:UDP-GlcNAc:undecaprenyl-phosphate GlcNAc-1-phosphate transferase